MNWERMNSVKKNSVYCSSKEPTGEISKGDVWYKVINPDIKELRIELKVFDGNEWNIKKE